MIKLSAVVITLNEEKNIGRCLNSLKGVVDEIVVVDSFSTDGTIAIANSFNAKIFQCEWEGYARQKNFGNSAAANNWILSLDADEELSDELMQSIIQLKSSPHPMSCSFSRLTNYCGKWIKHGGWYPDIKTRLFDRTKFTWQGIIHETLAGENDTEVKLLKGICYHYSFYSREEHLRVADKYTTIAAKELYEQNKSAPLYKLIFSPLIKFIRDYFINLGFLDGSAGFTISRISAYATFLKYKKLRQLRNDAK